MRKNAGCFTITLALMIAVSAPSTSSADTGMAAWIHEAVQEDQNVEITLMLYQPALGWSHTLRRDGPDGETYIIQGRDLVAAEAESIGESHCESNYSDEEGCADNPGCTDCDGNGIPECLPPNVDCVIDHYFVIVDECVEPGEYTYFLETTGFMEDPETIRVTDTGDPCLETGEDQPDAGPDDGGPDDAGPDDGPDDTDSGGDCSVAASPAGSATGAMVAVAMLLIGLFARFGRSERG